MKRVPLRVEPPFERQAELVLDQIKCNVYCTDASHFDTFNEIYEVDCVAVV